MGSDMAQAALSPSSQEFHESSARRLAKLETERGSPFFRICPARRRSLARSKEPRSNAAGCGRRTVEHID
jgi:hypothetical protein